MKPEVFDMTYTNLHFFVTLMLAGFVVCSGFCRMVMVQMQGVQYRYIAPFVLCFFWGLGVAASLLGGDRVDWFQPLGLMGIAVYLWNTKVDWKHGMPKHYLRSNIPEERVARQKLITIENVVVATGMAVSLGVAGVGAADGSGDPIQIYSAYARPPVVPAGGNLDIVYSFRRVRVCPGYANRFIIDTNSGETVQAFPATPTGGSAVGQKLVGVPVSITLSPTLPPGRYIFRSVLYNNCEDAVYTKQTPDVPFIID